MPAGAWTPFALNPNPGIIGPWVLKLAFLDAYTEALVFMNVPPFPFSASGRLCGIRLMRWSDMRCAGDFGPD